MNKWPSSLKQNPLVLEMWSMKYDIGYTVGKPKEKALNKLMFVDKKMAQYLGFRFLLFHDFS